MGLEWLLGVTAAQGRGEVNCSDFKQIFFYVVVQVAAVNCN